MNPPHVHIDEKNILDNRTRGTLYSLITTNPGTTFGELLGWLGVSHTTLQYHVQLLEEFELINTRWDGRHVYYYSADVPRWDRISKTQKAILSAALEMPALSQEELSDKLGFSAGKMSYHLRQLVDSGLARVERDGKKNRVYAAQQKD